MRPRGISQNALARALGITPRRINLIIQQRRSISPETALLLSRFLNTTAEKWVDLQARHDLWEAGNRPQTQHRLSAIAPWNVT